MKKSIVLLALLGLFSLNTYSQDDVSCYMEYSKVFEQRGANTVEDGDHDNVIITIRSAVGTKAECLMGKVKVKDKKVVEMKFRFTDGSFEKYEPSYKFTQDAIITNGISKTLITVDDKLVNVLFINHIKPKKKEYEKAPLPSFDF
jgi:hypothetical protein